VRIVRAYFFAYVVLACGLAGAQRAGAGSTDTLAYENGSIANNIYTNECFGFSLAITDGWFVNGGFAGSEIRGRHISGGELVLLALKQETPKGHFKNAIALKALPAIPSDMTAQEFVSNRVHAQIDIVDREKRELVREPYSVEYRDRRFFRADYRTTMKGMDVYMPMNHAFVYTKFRGYFIGGDALGRSLELLDQSVSALENVSFREDERNPKCGMSGADNAGPGGVKGYISRGTK
jgi:hypothetical protein